MINASEIQNLINGIKLLSCDVDGVMTDGGLYYGEMRQFHVLDRLGIQNLMKGIILPKFQTRELVDNFLLISFS